MVKFSNPQLQAKYDDWPLGRVKRGVCRFQVEFRPGKGYRVSRTTENPETGKVNKPKYTTYSGRIAIVDGDDGEKIRTYLLVHHPEGKFIKVLDSSFMNADWRDVVFPNEPALVFYRDECDLYMALLHLINEPYEYAAEAIASIQADAGASGATAADNIPDMTDAG